MLDIIQGLMRWMKLSVFDLELAKTTGQSVFLVGMENSILVYFNLELILIVERLNHCDADSYYG